MIGILNYGIGNIKSIVNMLNRVEAPNFVVNNFKDFNLASKLILPGVGHFGSAMASLQSLGFKEPIKDYAKMGRPILGICLGMQLLTNYSEESGDEGLGLILGKTIKIRSDQNIKVPHVGFNLVHFANTPLTPHNLQAGKFYFTHSYKVVTEKPENCIGNTNYGGPVCCAIQSENVFGVQFHPEKSHQFGMALLKSFNENL
jgi:glutamine amidotransferase